MITLEKQSSIGSGQIWTSCSVGKPLWPQAYDYNCDHLITDLGSIKRSSVVYITNLHHEFKGKIWFFLRSLQQQDLEINNLDKRFHSEAIFKQEALFFFCSLAIVYLPHSVSGSHSQKLCNLFANVPCKTEM